MNGNKTNLKNREGVKLAIGMPVFERAWCLPLWFDCLEAQDLVPKEDITLCFAYSKSYDGTYDILRYRGDEYGDLLIYQYDLPTYSSRENMARFNELAALRNALLDMVKETDADYFLSWDNDILFPPRALQHLFIDKDAVGACIDMGGIDEEMGHPSVMHFPQHEMEVAYRRPWSEYKQDEPFQCDIIMAVKLMKKKVYSNTRYRWDAVGEDIGWCHDCEEKGYERWLQPLARGYHLYDKTLNIEIMKQYSELEYPEILEPLRTRVTKH